MKRLREWIALVQTQPSLSNTWNTRGMVLQAQGKLDESDQFLQEGEWPFAEVREHEPQSRRGSAKKGAN